jgi:hypothetical protein
LEIHLAPRLFFQHALTLLLKPGITPASPRRILTGKFDRTVLTSGDLQMNRVSFLAGGLVALAGWMMFRQPISEWKYRHSHAKVPIKLAAEKLQQAWADHHTRA